MKSKHLILWLTPFGIATLIVLTDVGQDYIRDTMHHGGSASLLKLFLWPSIWWYTWAFLGVGVLHLSHRHLITKENWRTPLGIHLLGCLVCYALHVMVQVSAMVLPPYQFLHPTFSHAFTHHALTSIFLNVLIYWSVAGVSHAVIFYKRYREREVETAMLESALHKAQLDALKMQLQPHFLFNTLHAVSTLMYRDVAAADKIIAQLGNLLRRTIDQSSVNEVPLHQEIDFIQKYLEIEQARFEDRLSVQINIAPEATHALVPNLILQPIVENAIKHGVSTTSRQGIIDIKAWVEEEKLCLWVADNGPGMQGDPFSHAGTGLLNTKKRLANLYGSQFQFLFTPNAPTGLSVSIRLPLAHRSTIHPIEEPQSSLESAHLRGSSAL